MGYNYPGEMVSLGGNRGWLDRAAAESIWRIDRALGHLLQITEAGRTWTEQNKHWTTYLRNGWPIALNPDTPSEHQKGKAVDSNEAQRILRLMEEHGWRRTVYRWVNGVWTLVEEWHFEHFAHLDNHRNDPAPAGGSANPIPKPPTEEEQIMGVADDITNKLGLKIDGLDTRRDTAVVEVEGNFYVVDHAQGTKWNAIRGQNSVEDAFKFIGWLRDLGIARYDGQAPYTLVGYRDITDEDISEEIAAGVRAGVATASTLAITLTKEQIDQLSAALAARLAEGADEEATVTSVDDVRHALVALPFVTAS